LEIKLTPQLLHSPEQIARAVELDDGHYVQLSDYLFERHGLGPRYARVLNVEVGGRALSYAYLDLADATLDLITAHDEPVDLGTYDALVSPAAGDKSMFIALEYVFAAGGRLGTGYVPQQMALALIKANADGTQPADELAMRRLTAWARLYEMRAWWIAKHRAAAYALEKVDWRALGM
jgi:hypothetical protein